MTKRNFDIMTTDTDSLSSLRVQRTSPTAKLPARATSGSAGYDLCASEPALVKTGLVIALAEGTYGRVAPWRGLAVKSIRAGFIDADYRGEVGLLLFNFGGKEFPMFDVVFALRT
ncbi:dUTPase-like protein [Cladochytrium replicatum]|nr:dUTPase-like protein [Cladochytrium replicatum]